MSKHFGIELEYKTIADQYNTNQLFYDLWNNTGHINQCCIGTDHCGYEFRTPKMDSTEQDFRKVLTFFKGIHNCIRTGRIPGLSKLFARDTGLHVHVDISSLSDRSLDIMLKTFYLFEPRILDCVHKCRSSSTWCKQMRKLLPVNKNINDYDFAADYFDRRDNNMMWGLNPFLRNTSYYPGVCLSDRYATVEARYSRALCNPEQIMNWLLLMLIIVENSKNINKFQIPLTLEGKVRKDAESATYFAKFINEARIKRNMRWLTQYQDQVAKWVLKKASKPKNRKTAVS